MKALSPQLLALLIVLGAARGAPVPAENPAQAPAAQPAQAPAAADFNPYVPEEFNSVDKYLNVKCFTFSQRQLEYMASMDFDEERFGKYLRTKWSIEKLTEYARHTPQEKLPRKVGYNAGSTIKIDVYRELKHKFDSLEVYVFDQYGNSIAPNQLHSSNADGTRSEIKRWAWLIGIKKGNKSWTIQSELPNREFDKKRAEQPVDGKPPEAPQPPR